MLHRELELEVRGGIPAPKALQIATLRAAQLLGQQAELGSIAPGKRADFLLVMAILPRISATFATAGWL